jgi:uncharacterized protein YbaR (Trm112 family)
MSLEVLACPHCDRLFQVTPAALGKKIRCRGCREIFHVPQDTTSVPDSQLDSAAAQDASLPPVAIPCVLKGHDARSCPECGRTFRMKEAFAGKSIRCRGCKVTFRVLATPEAAHGAESVATSREQSLDGHTVQPVIAPLQQKEATLTAEPPPTIFEDIGDVLGDFRPGEKVKSVVRPRNVPRIKRVEPNPVATFAAIIFGGVCAVPVAGILLRIIDADKYRQIVRSLPPFLRDWLL